MPAAASPTRSRSNRGSATAVLSATIRAAHLRFDPAPIFEDRYALRMLPPFWRAVAACRPLNWLVGDIVLGVYRPVYPSVLLRARYTEDQLQDAVAAGAGQYVLLGAGFDTFALRRGQLAGRVRIFEVDHPATQQVKRRRILKANGFVPPNLTFVPVDFERDRLDRALAQAGFDPRTPAFFSWLGVTYYLTRAAVRDTLDRIAAVSAPGSRIVFDWKIAKHLMPAHWNALAQRMERFAARLGEPMLTYFTPHALREMMAAHGYAEVEMVPPAEQARRYLAARADLAPAAYTHFAHFAVAPPPAPTAHRPARERLPQPAPASPLPPLRQPAFRGPRYYPALSPAQVRLSCRPRSKRAS